MTAILLDLCIFQTERLTLKQRGTASVQAHICSCRRRRLIFWPEAAVKTVPMSLRKDGEALAAEETEAVRGRPLLLKQLPMTAVPV